MRRVRDVIRLKAAGMPTREVARRVGTAPSTVRLTIRRFEASGRQKPKMIAASSSLKDRRLAPRVD
ncbi:helix-turn-helix domain-containing protein [Bradyrhizobium elkanii]|nr:helix-turn-helix domain-containing protein [Bradyrhizobium elkanii]